MSVRRVADHDDVGRAFLEAYVLGGEECRVLATFVVQLDRSGPSYLVMHPDVLGEESLLSVGEDAALRLCTIRAITLSKAGAGILAPSTAIHHAWSRGERAS